MVNRMLSEVCSEFELDLNYPNWDTLVNKKVADMW